MGDTARWGPVPKFSGSFRLLEPTPVTLSGTLDQNAVAAATR
jgi:hypothetical protein